jgi:TetR/AcrR family transcriptional regulator
LISTATRLFAERGLHGVSIRNSPNRWSEHFDDFYYFGGKEGCTLRYAKQFAIYDYIEEINKMNAEPLAKIEAYIRWTVKRHRINPFLLRFYTSELTNPTRFFASIVQPAIGNVIQTLIEIVNEGIARKQFREGLNPVDTVLVMASMANYYFLSTLATDEFVNHSPERDEELLQHYMDIFTKGILN